MRVILAARRANSISAQGKRSDGLGMRNLDRWRKPCKGETNGSSCDALTGLKTGSWDIQPRAAALPRYRSVRALPWAIMCMAFGQDYRPALACYS